LNAEEKAQTSQSPDYSPLTSNLLRLDQAVMSFVNNPLFHQPKLLDSKLTTKADDDLDEIVRLAEAVKGVASSLPK